MSMAETYDTDLEYEIEKREETPPRPERPALQDILATDNVCDLLSDTRLNLIGALCQEEYDIDKKSMSNWLERNERGFDLAMQVAKVKSYPFTNASNVIYPLITVAAMQFAARAYPAIVPDRSIVKGAVNGNDKGTPQIGPDGQPMPQTGPDGQPTGEPVWAIPPGAKAKKAQRIARHMSWQLLEEEENWESDTDTLLHYLPIAGCCFRKRWFDLSKQKICSRWIPATELVVNYHARSMDDAPRKTETFTRLPHQVEELMRSGAWKQCSMTELRATAGEESDPDKGQDPQDDDSPISFGEQHRRLDLDGDGYAEPYVVTYVEGGHKVVRIEKAFGPNAVRMDGANVVRIAPDQFYTKYTFIPNPEGGFYDIGFGWLLTPLNEAINTAINQLFDAGHLANTPMGFVGQGLRLKTGAMRFQPGEWKVIGATGGNLRENLHQLTFAGPSDVLFKLLGLLIDSANDISAVKDILMGKMDKNIAPTTALTLVEQGSKQFTAIFKRVHRSIKRELKQLFRLNREFMPAKVYFALLDEPEAVVKEDYATDELDVVPVSDPNMVTDAVRMAKAETLMALRGDPGINQIELKRRYLEALGVPEPEKLLVTDPPPDAKTLIDQGRLENDALRVKTAALVGAAQITELRARAVKNLAEAEAAELGAQLDQYVARMNAIAGEGESDAA